MAIIHILQWYHVVDTAAYAQIGGSFKIESLVVAPLMHGTPLHFMSSSIFLVVFGAAIEYRFGSSVVLFLFIVGSLCGGICWGIYGSPSSHPMLGAGAPVSMLGAICLVAISGRSATSGLIITWIISQFVFAPDDFSTPYMIHLGGALPGLLIGIIILVFREKEEMPELINIQAGITQDKRLQSVGGLFSGQTNTALRTVGRVVESLSSIKIPTVQQQSQVPRNEHSVDLQLENGQEVALKQQAEANPKDLSAHCQLLDLYLKENDLTETIKYGVQALKLLLENGDTSTALNYFKRIVKKFPDADLTALDPSIYPFIRPLLKRTLVKEEVKLSDYLVKIIRRSNPEDPQLPVIIAKLIQQLANNLGPQDPLTATWYKILLSEFRTHPATKAITKKMGKALGHEQLFKEANFDYVYGLIKQNRLEEVSEVLIGSKEIMMQIEPHILFGICKRLIKKNSLLPKAVILLELTVRSHLEHPNTPNLIVELMGIYMSRLHQVDHARRWRDFLLGRWPESDAARRVRELMPE